MPTYQHHTMLCSKGITSLVSSRNISPICWRNKLSCWMLLAHGNPGFDFTFTSSVICYLHQAWKIKFYLSDHISVIQSNKQSHHKFNIILWNPRTLWVCKGLWYWIINYTNVLKDIRLWSTYTRDNLPSTSVGTCAHILKHVTDSVRIIRQLSTCCNFEVHIYLNNI
jgi:hypothetical protein